MTEHMIPMNFSTRERRDESEWQRLRSQPPTREPPPQARPAESYGIPLVDCVMKQRARLPLASCKSRWVIANRPAKNTSSARTGGFESDLRASHCNGCPTGAERCGKKPRPPKPIVDRTRVCCTKGCGQSFSPDVEHQIRCERCIANAHAREGLSVTQRRVWGRGTAEGGPGGHTR